MKIEESSVQLDASHSLSRSQRREVESEFRFSQALSNADAALPAAETGRPDAQREAEKVRRLLQELVAAILAVLSGEKCRCEQENLALPEGDAAAPAAGRPRGFVEWKRSTVEHIEEHEETTVAARGQVRTADGRNIDFQLDLSMCRDYACTRETVEQGRIEFKDPLVLNFDGKAVELSEERFSFDLDADGRVELVPKLGAGSGYVCFDADGDGRIADGRELFGATGTCAGDGFADLARHDADKNGWIDEADPAWAALGVWFPDGRITPLKEAGVGAINLASAWSPFALKDGDNQSLGQVWRTGVFLHEDGRVGSAQQIDLGTLQPGADGDAGAARSEGHA